MKLSVPTDCDNAPKKQYIRDFNIAFAEGNTQKILDMMSDDAIWTLIGNESIQGKEAIQKALESMKLSKATELEIHHILTHGDEAAANGVMKFKDSTVSFCDIYVFTSHAKDAKIKELISYGIDTK